MNRRRMLIPVVGAICLGFLVALLGVAFNGKSEKPSDSGTIFVAGSGCDKVSVVRQALTNLGFAPEDYKIGVKNIDFTVAEANERSSNASFSTQTPKSEAEVVKSLGLDTQESNAALAHILQVSGSSREAVLNTKNWVGVQFAKAVNLPGNTGYRDGKVFDAGNRVSAPGDVIWHFVSPTKCRLVSEGKIKPEDAVSAHRGACGNPQSELPRPIPGPGPSPTPPTNPPTTPTTAPPCGDLCKGPDIDPAPCVDNNGVRCDGIPGSGGSPGNGGAVDHGDDGYSPSDPPPPPVVTTVPPPTSVATLPPTSLPPTTTITAPPG